MFRVINSCQPNAKKKGCKHLYSYMKGHHSPANAIKKTRTLYGCEHLQKPTLAY